MFRTVLIALNIATRQFPLVNKGRDIFIILTPAFAAYEGDTWLPAQERFVIALNHNFPSLHVVILTFHFPIGKQKQYKWYGNDVITFSGGMKRKLNTLIRWKNVWAELKHLNKSRIVGVFSFFCSECALIGHYFAKRYHLKHYIWVLGQDAKKENRQVKRIKPKADELICISDFLVREFHKNHHIRPAHVLPIGIDTTLFQPVSTPRAIDILGVGSLIPLKQYDVFIRVVKLIAESIPTINATICGDGPERQHLEALVIEPGFNGEIVLAGRNEYTATLQLMQQARILLHTSSYEGFGAVCIEALYAGAHVISFCQPMDASINHWHIVSTPQEMAAKAIELLNDRALDHKPVLPYEVNNISIEIMKLFGYKPDSTS